MIMKEDASLETLKTRLKRIGIYAAVVLVIFLLGFVPMWFKARQSANQLTESQRQLNLAQVQNTLSAAVIYARRADYETARRATSEFFTSLHDETNKGEASIFTAAQRQQIDPLFAQRDDLVTLLARSDPASADRLSDLFVSYQRLMSS
jgi:hypothetical protein